jgi:hypothetical protein
LLMRAKSSAVRAISLTWSTHPAPHPLRFVDLVV